MSADNKLNLAGSFKDWVAQTNKATHEAAAASTWTKQIYSFLNTDVQHEVANAVNPATTTAVDRQTLRYATMALNYANVPHAKQIATLGVRLNGNMADKKEAKKVTHAAMLDAVPFDDINLVAKELEQQMKKVEYALAAIDGAYAAYADGSEITVAANKIQQAKFDLELAFKIITEVSELVDKIASSLSSTGGNNAAIVQTFDMLLRLIDAVFDMLNYVDSATKNMTQEEYERVMALVAALDKNGALTKSASITDIMYTVVVVAMDVIRPYVQNLMLMLTMDCFNELIRIIKKIPGVSVIFQPPLNMIEPAATLIGMLMSGNLVGLQRRLGDDIKIIYDFIRASKIVANASDAELKAAELKIKEEQRGISADNKSAVDITEPDEVSAAVIAAAVTHNEQLQSEKTSATDACETALLSNELAEAAADASAKIEALAEKEETATVEATNAEKIAEADKYEFSKTAVGRRHIIITH